jgi:class 3 adenylate cyclase
VIVFDRRGVGLSDPVVDWERPVLDQWADDLAAVVHAADARAAVIVGIEGFGVGSRYAACHPERVGHLVVYDPMVVPDDRWDEWCKVRADRIAANVRGEIDLIEDVAASRAADPSFRDWYGRAGRAGASPAMAPRIWSSVLASHPRDQLLERVEAPILVLHRRDNPLAPPGLMEYLESLIPHATLVEVEGRDGFAFVGDVDALVAEIAEFLTGERRLPPPDRHLAAVLFSDIVGSTARAVSLGDARWKSALDRHDTALRAAVGRSGGTVVKTTGDGVLAVFPSSAGALESATRARARLADDDLEIRIGVHVGDIDRRGDDVSGIAVNVAARVMGHAPDGDVAVTASVVAAVAGQGLAFEPIGTHELKGIPGAWELFRLADDERSRSAR